MKEALLKLIDNAARHYSFFKSLPCIDALIFSINDLLNRKRVIRTVIDGTKLCLRTATSDFEVARSSLLFREYGNIIAGRPKVIVDAGANIGTSSIAFAIRFPDAKIYAIEMERENFKLLSQNTKPYPNITPILAALASASGIKVIYDRLTGPWGYTVSNTTNRGISTGQEVNCINLDDLMRTYGINFIDILKLDIEGGEKELFEVGGSWLSKTSIIAVELHDRICMGCDRAFYLATKGFSFFERHGEKVTAYWTKP